MERIKTGIEGLDELLDGGFEKGALVEIAGDAGTFKSTFALQFAIQGVRNREKVTYISLEEPKESFTQTAIDLGFGGEFSAVDFKTIDLTDVINSLKFSVNSADGAEGLAKKIVKIINAPQRLVLDTVTTMALYSSRTSVKISGQNHYQFVAPSAGDIRVMLFYLASELRKKKGCTVLLLAESGNGNLYLPEQVLKYICDGKIELKKSALGTRTPRSLVIEKMRHTAHTIDEQPLILTRNGLRVEKIGP